MLSHGWAEWKQEDHIMAAIPGEQSVTMAGICKRGILFAGHLVMALLLKYLQGPILGVGQDQCTSISLGIHEGSENDLNVTPIHQMHRE